MTLMLVDQGIKLNLNHCNKNILPMHGEKFDDFMEPLKLISHVF